LSLVDVTYLNSIYVEVYGQLYDTYLYIVVLFLVDKHMTFSLPFNLLRISFTKKDFLHTFVCKDLSI